MFLKEIKKTESFDTMISESALSSKENLEKIKGLKYNVTAKNHGTFRATPWQLAQNPLAPQLLDINWLISQPIFPFLIQVASPQLLYRSIQAHGLEDSLEVIEWIRGKQLQEVLDYDLWIPHPDIGSEDISAEKLMNWLKSWIEIGPEFAAERFFELEEETILLALSQILQILPEGVGQITDDVRENWWKTNDNKFYLKLKHEANAENFEILKAFIDGLYQFDARLAGNALAYSAMLIRAESLEDALRWRRVRLADQGFVETAEALQTLAPKKLSNLKKTLQDASYLEKKRQESQEKIKYISDETRELPPETIDKIMQILCSVTPQEGVKILLGTLGHEEVKLINGTDSIENFINCYDDEDFLHEAAEKLYAKCEKLLSYSQHIYSRKVNKNALLIEQVFSHLGAEDFTKELQFKERLSRLANILIAGAAEGYDNDNIERSLYIVRGFLNIGLETLLQRSQDYGLSLTGQSDLKNGSHCLDLLGVEFLFQVGWNRALSLQENMLKEITKLKENSPEDPRIPGTSREIALSDNEKISVSILKLWEQQRFPDLAKWLEGLEHRIPNEVFTILKAVFGKIPLYPEVLSQKKEEGDFLVTQSAKPLELASEIEKIELFISNIKNNF